MVEKVQTQNHLGLKLDKKLSFKKHLEDNFAKVNRGIGILKKLSGFLPRHSLITLYKSFIRPHLDYADIIYDQPNNLDLYNKIETCQYNAALPITGAIRGSSKERLYQELGFKYLSPRRWLRKLLTFYKIVRNKSPGYIYKQILPGDRAYLTRNSNNIKQIFCRFEYFANSFFPYAIKEWNKLSLEIRNSESYSIFKNSWLKFIRTIPNSVFSVVNIYEIKLLTRLRVGLSHLREHKFRHNFQDAINPLCSCSLKIESTSHFFLCCKNFITPRTNLMNELRKLDSHILNLDEISLTKLFLYGDSTYENNVSKKILLASINFLLSTK